MALVYYSSNTKLEEKLKMESAVAATEAQPASLGFQDQKFESAFLLFLTFLYQPALF